MTPDGDDEVISVESLRAIERLFAAFPELRQLAEDWWADPIEEVGAYPNFAVFGRHLNALVGADRVPEHDEAAHRAFAFLEDLSRDGLEELANEDDSLLYGLAQEMLDDILHVNLARAYPLMGPATRILLEKQKEWNDFALLQAQRRPGNWIIENIESFHQAYQQATSDHSAPEPDEPAVDRANAPVRYSHYRRQG